MLVTAGVSTPQGLTRGRGVCGIVTGARLLMRGRRSTDSQVPGDRRHVFSSHCARRGGFPYSGWTPYRYAHLCQPRTHAPTCARHGDVSMTMGILPPSLAFSSAASRSAPLAAAASLKPRLRVGAGREGWG